jgi:hypothetical protein
LRVHDRANEEKQGLIPRGLPRKAAIKVAGAGLALRYNTLYFVFLYPLFFILLFFLAFANNI